MSRIGRVERQTAETKVLVSIDLDGARPAPTSPPGSASSTTCWHPSANMGCSTSRWRSRVTCTSTRTTPSRTPRSRSARRSAQAAGDKAGTRRFGDASIPMDEVLVSAAVDLSGRPYLVHTEPDGAPAYLLGQGVPYATTLTRHVLGVLRPARPNRAARHGAPGRDWHHITEAQYKAVARALRAAVEPDPRQQGVPSTKGVL